MVAILIIQIYVFYRVNTELQQHSSVTGDNPSNYGLNAQDENFPSTDGVQLSGWYVDRSDAKTTVILVPGFQKTKASLLPLARDLYQAGYAVFLVDLRAQGESTGNRVYLGTREWEDVATTYDFVKAIPENNSRKVGFIGVSMGASSVLNEVGKTGKGDFVVAGVPFANFNHLIPLQLNSSHLSLFFEPFVKVATFLEFGTRYFTDVPAHQIANIHVPILLMGGDKDQTVPPGDAAYLFGLAHSPRLLWQSPNGHFIYTDDPAAFLAHALPFLGRYGSNIN